MHACACKIDDIEALVQSSRVHTKRVHNNLHEHECMSITYMSNLVRMYVGVYMTIEIKDNGINSMNMFLY